jgi:hypothetical protein
MTLSGIQEDILKFFPEVELPLLISEDQLSEFESNNDPFPKKFLDEIMTHWENQADEYTEYIPCVSLPIKNDFITVVYWKGSLLKYDFILANIDKQGHAISRKSIAGTHVVGDSIFRSVAYIDTDLNISVMKGQGKADDLYDSSMSEKIELEILSNGEIVRSDIS